MDYDKSMALTDGAHRQGMTKGQKGGLFIGMTGLFIIIVSWLSTWTGVALPGASWWLFVALAAILVGTVIFARGSYLPLPEGIKNNGVWFKSMSARGVVGWISAIAITGLYVLLYWFPKLLGLGDAAKGVANGGLVALFDPLSRFFKGAPADQWFVYGTLYTLAILAFGVKFILKYRHNRYQVVRTISVMASQLVLAFLIPEILQGLNTDKPYFAKDLKNMWPLNYYFFEEWHLDNMQGGGNLGMIYLIWGILLVLLVSPVLTYFFGKRWYCSWVCGCGGLAETAGDPYRQLSDKSTEAWQIERVLIHGVLVFIILNTVLVLISYFTGWHFKFQMPVSLLLTVLWLSGVGLFFLQRRRSPSIPPKRLLQLLPTVLGVITLYFYITVIHQGQSMVTISDYKLREWYAFFIGAAFSGVVGVGFYPLLGNRVWCRFGCPAAAILGLQQRFFSRFRITTNGGQCISCGNCSTYCEMGIDVRSYAQKGQSIVRASCVGCGVCSAVCPRGVLRLESGPVNDRTSELRTLHVSPEGGVRL